MLSNKDICLDIMNDRKEKLGGNFYRFLVGFGVDFFQDRRKRRAGTAHIRARVLGFLVACVQNVQQLFPFHRADNLRKAHFINTTNGM